MGSPGIEETEEGHYIVFWTGEKSLSDNSQVGAPLNLVRDINFIMLDTDLNIVTPDVYDGDSDIEDDTPGGFYDSDGTFVPLTNTGIVKLTNYADDLADNG